MLACSNNIYPIGMQTPNPCWIALHDQQPSLITLYQNYIGSGLSQFRDVFYTATNIIQTLSMKSAEDCNICQNFHENISSDTPVS